MKEPIKCRYPVNVLITFILTIDLMVLSDAASLRKHKVEILLSSDYVQMTNITVPPLGEFTWCLDLNRIANTHSWTAFSYAVAENNEVSSPELGLAGFNKKLELYYLENTYEVDIDLPIYSWHFVCSSWNSSSRQLDLYVNGSHIYNITTSSPKQPRANGTLVLGAKHVISGGNVDIVGSNSLLGNIYNFQMWNSKRPQETIGDCSDGNVVSWRDEFWIFKKNLPTEDKSLRCAGSGDIPSTASTTTRRTSLGISTSTLPGTTTRRSETPTTQGTSESNNMSTEHTMPSSEYITTSQMDSTVTLSVSVVTNSSEIYCNTISQLVITGSSDPTRNASSSSTATTQGSQALVTPPTVPDTSTFTFPETTRTSVISTTTWVPETNQASTTNITPSNGSITTSQTEAAVTTHISTITEPSGISSTTEPQHKTPGSTNTVSNTFFSSSTPSVATSQVVQSLMTTHADASNIPTIETNEKTSASESTVTTDTVTFFLVIMNITVSGADGIITEELALNLTQKLINSTFEDTDFAVIQFTVHDDLSYEPWKTPTQKSRVKRRDVNEDSGDFTYESKLIVQAVSSETSESLAGCLKDLLDSVDYTDVESKRNVSVQSVKVQRIVPGHCPPENTYSSDKGWYEWAERSPGETASVTCCKNPNEFATRYCNINITYVIAEWENPNLEKCQSICPLPETIKELRDVLVTSENAKDLADHIFILTKNLASLSEEETDIILRKLSEIVKLGGTDMASAKTNLDILNAIMMKADNLRIFTNRILQITQEIGYKVTFLGDTANVTSETMAFSVSLVNLTDFMEIFFTVKSYLEGTAPEISQQRDNKAVAFVNVPEEIKHHTVTPTSKVQFNFFGKTSLFEDNHLSGYKLNTYVVSADVENTRIKELNEPVYITLRHIESNTAMSPVRCAYWDFNASGGLGGWDSYGCTVHCTNINSTTCHCSHLTHFGVLLDVSRTEVNAFDDHILSLLTYVGCGIASLFLGISLVTYMAFKPLRRDYPSKILMNLSCSLLMLNLVFLTNNWLSSFRNYGLCIAWAALLHYFLLASFTWMGLEAVHMYFAFVKVFNLYIRNYILKFCIAGWGIPVIVIAIVLVINRDYYGSESNLKKSAHPTESSELFCWIQNDVVFYVTVVAYFCVIFLANISMFIVVLLQINSLKSKKMKDWRELFLHDLKSTMSLAFLLGLTWGFVFFAWGPVRVAFLYLFSIFNTLQGFFIFVFHCLMKENVRKQWRMHLCCGRFRLDNCSDWSKLSNGEAKQNSRIRTSPSDSFQSTRSNTTASTSNSSSLSGFSREGYSGNSLGNGGIFMSSTPMAPPNHVTVHHDPR